MRTFIMSLLVVPLVVGMGAASPGAAYATGAKRVPGTAKSHLEPGDKTGQRHGRATAGGRTARTGRKTLADLGRRSKRKVEKPASAAKAGAVSSLPHLGGGQLSLFRTGRATTVMAELEGFFAQSPRLAGMVSDWDIDTDVGENPNDASEYFIQLKHKTTGEYRLVSVVGQRPSLDAAGTRALAWTSGNRLFVVKPPSKSGYTPIGLTTDGAAGSFSHFHGTPTRVTERADGGFVVEGTDPNGVAKTAVYSANLVLSP